MANENNYDQNYNSSDTYGSDESEFGGGGEQIDSARYFNEQLSKIGADVITVQQAAEAAQFAADEAQEDANAAQTAADDAQQAANVINGILADLSNDDKITAVEKQTTKNQWDGIVAEKPHIDIQADTYGIDKTNYTNTYNALNTYLTPLLADLTTTSDISGAEFRLKFKAYLDTKTALLGDISAKAKQLADTAQNAADNAAGLANGAQSSANAAQIAADEAQEAATAAQGAADSANAVAVAAQSAANAAQTTADNANVAAGNAQTSATTANNLLSDLANDNKLTAVEKQDTKKEWDVIAGEKTNIEAQATTYAITTEKTTYTNAYTALSTYITPLLSSLTTTSDIVGTTFRTNFKTYYDARTALLKKIAEVAKSLADTAQTAANNAKSAADTAQTAANNAQTSATAAQTAADDAQFTADGAQTAADNAQATANAAQTAATAAQTAADTAKSAADTAQSAANAAQSSANTANGLLSDLANDNKLTAVEKQDTKKEWDIIVGEKTNIEAQATTYGITTEKTTYTNAYNALSTYITPLLSNLGTTSDIVGTTFRTNFKTYYDAKTALLKKIAESAKNLADTAQTAANTAQQAANTAKNAADNAQQAADTAQATANSKQNAIVVQPMSPPANPELHDMWINTEVFPNVIYTWDGEEWVKATATSAAEVGSYSIANVDNQLNGVRTDIEAVKSRTTDVENFVNDGSLLAARVTETTQYQDSVKTIAKGEITTAIDALDMAQYVTSAELAIESNAINARIQAGSGVNIVRNSVGYGGLTHWQVVSGAVTVVQGSHLVDAGSGFSIVTGVMKQVVTGFVGQPYTLTCKVNKGTAGTAYMKLSDGNVFEQINMIATQAYEYTEIQIDGYIPNTGALIVEFGASGATGGAVFTSIMLNLGEIGLQWSHALGEMYNTNVKVDINGLEVKSTAYDGYTVMSPIEFAGYARNNQGTMEKVFTLNKETTEMKQAKVKEFMTVGSIRMTKVDGGGFKGLAWIKDS